MLDEDQPGFSPIHLIQQLAATSFVGIDVYPTRCHGVDRGINPPLMHLRADEHLLEMGIKLNDEGASGPGEDPRTVGSLWDVISQLTV